MDLMHELKLVAIAEEYWKAKAEGDEKAMEYWKAEMDKENPDGADLG